MQISMSPKAHYVVQTGAYARLLIGRPLSNRKINEYVKRGYYGIGHIAVERKAKTKRKQQLSDFL